MILLTRPEQSAHDADRKRQGAIRPHGKEQPLLASRKSAKLRRTVWVLVAPLIVGVEELFMRCIQPLHRSHQGNVFCRSGRTWIATHPLLGF